jgi:hypothetical protein
MSAPSPLPRRRRTYWSELPLLAEALASLAIASLMIRLLPFRRVMRWAAPRLRGRPPADRQAEMRRLRWAVTAWSQRVPWRAVCFQRGLALHAMLRRRGIASVLHYGVRQDADGVKAHVWLTLDGAEILGGEEARGFAELASWPPAALPSGGPLPHA